MGQRPSLVIDFHAHMLEPHALEQATGKTVLTAFGRRKASHAPPGGTIEQIMRKMLDPQTQVDDMDRRGVDVHVISSSTVIQGTSWADITKECTLIRRINDRAAEWCALHPRRFVGSFVLPLRDMKLAMAEFERAVGTLKLKIAAVSTTYNGVYLGHPEFLPFWEAAAASGTIVFVHPEGTTDVWFQDFSLWNSVGQPIEEAKAMASIIYEGIFDKFPGIKIVISHGGGYLPHYHGRLDRNLRQYPESGKNISRRPSEYLRSFYYDSCTYDPDVIAALGAKVGFDRLVMGSDYAVGDMDPVGSLRTVPSMTDDRLQHIISTTPSQLLGLDGQAGAAPPR